MAGEELVFAGTPLAAFLQGALPCWPARRCTADRPCATDAGHDDDLPCAVDADADVDADVYEQHEQPQPARHEPSNKTCALEAFAEQAAVFIQTLVLRQLHVLHGHRSGQAPVHEHATAQHPLSAFGISGSAVVSAAAALVAAGFAASSTRSGWTGWTIAAAGALSLLGAAAVQLRSDMRQHSQRKTQRQILAVLYSILAEMEGYSKAFHARLQSIHEVEMVARGYRLGDVLEPLSLLGLKASLNQVLELRIAVFESWLGQCQKDRLLQRAKKGDLSGVLDSMRVQLSEYLSGLQAAHAMSNAGDAKRIDPQLLSQSTRILSSSNSSNGSQSQARLAVREMAAKLSVLDSRLEDLESEAQQGTNEIAHVLDTLEQEFAQLASDCHRARETVMQQRPAQPADMQPGSSSVSGTPAAELRETDDCADNEAVPGLLLEMADDLHQLTTAAEDVFESAEAGQEDGSRDGRAATKLTRMERIALQKVQRAETHKRRVTQVSRLEVVAELSKVLAVRKSHKDRLMSAAASAEPVSILAEQPAQEAEPVDG
ncbi:hypothetical protein BC831DRAFT_442051 [Entophlyctis helioformis]|nr:hypothetical protein BC831DRAFT_442051 [Entophlyctis helioformis]